MQPTKTLGEKLFEALVIARAETTTWAALSENDRAICERAAGAFVAAIGAPPEPPPGLELTIFADAPHAANSGYRPDRRHPLAERLIAWWPSLDPDLLRGLQLARVTVTASAIEVASLKAGTPYSKNFYKGVQIARERLRLAPMLWIQT